MDAELRAVPWPGRDSWDASRDMEIEAHNDMEMSMRYPLEFPLVN